jgi:hypothetical protein
MAREVAQRDMDVLAIPVPELQAAWAVLQEFTGDSPALEAVQLSPRLLRTPSGPLRSAAPCQTHGVPVLAVGGADSAGADDRVGGGGRPAGPPPESKASRGRRRPDPDRSAGVCPALPA